MRIHNRVFQPHEPSLNSLEFLAEFILSLGRNFFFKKKGGKENLQYLAFKKHFNY
jgi:hypothetical protein